MIDILKNNLKEFSTENPNNNTIICDASELSSSCTFSSLSTLRKNSIHLNVNIYCDKDIEHFIYLEEANSYKSINIIFNSKFNLSKLACKKLEFLININSVLNYTDDNKIKGGSFKNYVLTTAVEENPDTYMLLSDNALYSLKNFSENKNNTIVFDNINHISKEILDFFKEKKYSTISFKDYFANNILSFNIDVLYIIIERIAHYTYSINFNMENTLKFNVIYKKVLNNLSDDYTKFLETKNEKHGIENPSYFLYKELSFYGYSIIIYQTLQNLNVPVYLCLSTLNKLNLERYYLQIKLDKYWFNLDLIWNFENYETETILKNDKEFFKTHTITGDNNNPCTLSYKKFYRKKNLFRLLKNKLFLLFRKNRKDILVLPAPDSNNTIKENSIFESHIN